MGIDLTLSLHQNMKLSPKQVQALEMLTIGVEELSDIVEKEYLENPLLDKLDHQVAKESVGPSYEESNYEHQEDRETLIFTQLREQDFSSLEWKLIHYLTALMDEDGYLRYKKEDILAKVKLPPESVDKCLRQLKMLEPAGIMAYDMEENLLLQLKRENKLTNSLYQMIKYHLTDIGNGKISTISRKLHLTTAQVRYNIGVIQALRPHPLEGYSGEQIEYVVPDLIVENEAGLVVVLNDHWVEDYQISDHYLKMMKETKDEELYKYFKIHYEKAKLMINNITKRRETLRGLGQALIYFEEEFFLGRSELKPLTMSKVAEYMGVHVSTVSRAVKNKYIQYPAGTLAIREIFQRPIHTGEKGETTAIQIKNAIGEIVKEENVKKPYSDSTIVKLLAKKDIKISRRAVAKYRSELYIRNSVDRKKRG